MIKNKIVQYLQTLNSSETRKFRDFVYSPYFNKHQKTKDFLDLLLVGLKKNEMALDRKIIFAQLFPKLDFDEHKLNNVVSFLQRLFVRFCAIEKFETKKWGVLTVGLEAAKEGGQNKLFERIANQLSVRFSNENQKDADFFFAQYHFFKICFDVQRNQNESLITEHLQMASDNLDLFFFTEKLRLYNKMLAQKEVVSGKYQLSFLEEIIAKVEHQKDYQNQPIIQVYYCVLKMLKEPENEAVYQELRELMGKYLSQFSKEEGLEIFNHAQNFCVRQINLGALNYLDELYDLYLEVLDNQLLTSTNSFNEWTYSNIISVSCRLKKFTWTKQFLEDYQKYLKESVRSNAYNYNLAFYHYQKEEFEPALQLLTTVKFTDFFYQHNSRLLLMKIYFATKEWTALEYSVESLRIYILRSKQVSSYRRKNILNLVRFVKKLAKLMESKASLSQKAFRQNLEKLSEKISLQQNISNKKWLLEQCIL
ncbi:MAG: hypothetical protein ACI85O_001517 [Saprospiraceae bacterium]|jgi:hypothetical protein